MWREEVTNCKWKNHDHAISFSLRVDSNRELCVNGLKKHWEKSIAMVFDLLTGFHSFRKKAKSKVVQDQKRTDTHEEKSAGERDTGVHDNLGRKTGRAIRIE